MKYEITRDWIYLDIDKETAKQFDAVFVDSKKMWKVPMTLGALKELREAKVISFNDLIRTRLNARSWLSMLKTKPDHEPGDKRLRPYQRVDVNYLSKIPHPAIFNEQRTGEQI